MVYRADLAEVAELVDALGSGSSGRMPVRVQIPASAPRKIVTVQVATKALRHEGYI